MSASVAVSTRIAGRMRKPLARVSRRLPPTDVYGPLAAIDARVGVAAADRHAEYGARSRPVLTALQPLPEGALVAVVPFAYALLPSAEEAGDAWKFLQHAPLPAADDLRSALSQTLLGPFSDSVHLALLVATTVAAADARGTAGPLGRWLSQLVLQAPSRGESLTRVTADRVHDPEFRLASREAARMNQELAAGLRQLRAKLIDVRKSSDDEEGDDSPSLVLPSTRLWQDSFFAVLRHSLALDDPKEALTLAARAQAAEAAAASDDLGATFHKHDEAARPQLTMLPVADALVASAAEVRIRGEKETASVRLDVAPAGEVKRFLAGHPMHGSLQTVFARTTRATEPCAVFTTVRAVPMVGTELCMAGALDSTTSTPARLVALDMIRAGMV